MKVHDLSGALLDLWVARAEGRCYTQSPGVWGLAVINELGRLSIAKNSWDCARYFEPSTNWAHAGPIIERERGEIYFERFGVRWVATMGCAPLKRYQELGDTQLEAAMRAYVGSKFGDVVSDEVTQ
jgi:hypothetical protein